MHGLRWLFFAVTVLWAVYLAWNFLLSVAATFGLDGGLDNGGVMSDLTDPLALGFHIADLTALSAYGCAAWLIAKARALAVPVYIFAFVIDISVWIVASAVYSGYDFTSFLHSPVFNWLANAVLLGVLAGLVMLAQVRTLR